jgi:prepilin-type N-terminal cleavage/methylation domain-containing protein
MKIQQQKALPARPTHNRVLRRRLTSSGFTIIELLVVLVILCILGSLVALTYSGVQAKNRNAERQADVDVLKGHLEGYYAQTNNYPKLADLNNASWRAQNMKKLQAKTLQDPRWDTKITDCTADGKAVIAAEPRANCYSYQVTASDGSACDNATVPCAHYTLTAQLEGGEKYVKASLN